MHTLLNNLNDKKDFFNCNFIIINFISHIYITLLYECFSLGIE